MAVIFGIEIKRAPKPKAKTVLGPQHKFVPGSDEKHLWIKNMGIKTVLDVGAHEGKTALQFLELFPGAEIHSFEPIPDCFAKLCEKTAHQSRCHAYNVAVGAEKGTISFHQSNYSPSSSILPMAKAHEQAFPFTAGGTEIKVEMTTLDDFTEAQKLVGPFALKIDVQGFEWQVLMGATQTLEKVRLLIVETSFVELYSEQKLFTDLYGWLTKNGFVYNGSFDQLFDPSNGFPIQQDAIFIRQS